MVTPVLPGTVWAGQCWCNSCCARRDVSGDTCAAIQATRAKEPYSLCLNRKSQWDLVSKVKRHIALIHGEPPFHSTDKSGKAQGFSGITVLIYTLSLIFRSTRSLHRVVLWWRISGLQTLISPCIIQSGEWTRVLEAEQAGKMEKTVTYKKGITISWLKSPFNGIAQNSAVLFSSQNWTRAREIETAPRGMHLIGFTV